MRGAQPLALGHFGRHVADDADECAPVGPGLDVRGVQRHREALAVLAAEDEIQPALVARE
jgi:hypothetical protein